MCTLACWVGQFPEAGIVVAANRDEKLDRPSSPPMVWPGSPRIVAPRDDVSGGSWWAVNEHGLFVGLTNRAGANVDPQRRSRGLLVMDVAAASSLDEAEQKLRAIQPEQYNGFHLLVTDGQDAVRAIDTGAALRIARLGPGFHILTERSFEAVPISRDANVQKRFGSMAERPLDLEEMQRQLASHELNPLTSICVHWDLANYGTRSSTILVLGREQKVLRFAPDAPCHTPFVDLSQLLC